MIDHSVLMTICSHGKVGTLVLLLRKKNVLDWIANWLEWYFKPFKTIFQIKTFLLTFVNYKWNYCLFSLQLLAVKPQNRPAESDSEDPENRTCDSDRRSICKPNETYEQFMILMIFCQFPWHTGYQWRPRFLTLSLISRAFADPWSRCTAGCSVPNKISKQINELL